MATNDTETFEVTSIGHYYEFIWNIEKFNLTLTDKNFESPEFSVAHDCTEKFKVIFEFRPSRNLFHAEATISLIKADSTKCAVKAQFKFLNIAVKETDLSEVLFETCFSATLKCLSKRILLSKPYHEFGVPIVQPDSKLIIKGYITVLQCESCEKKVKQLTNLNVLHLQNDFKGLLRSRQLADVTLKVQNEVIPAHKSVLCARSPVLRKMLETDMKEKACNSIDIIDMDKVGLEAFLTFLYTGVVEDLTLNTAIALYSAADKYDVKSLQETCRSIIIPYISENTVSVILKLADLHNDQVLKNNSVKFIGDNLEKVVTTAEWDNLLNTDLRLCSDVLKTVSLSMSGRAVT